MTDQRTMRTFLDLVAERDEALGAATDLAEQAELTMLELRYAEFVHDVLRDCLRAADAERDEALGEATRLADLLDLAYRVIGTLLPGADLERLRDESARVYQAHRDYHHNGHTCPDEDVVTCIIENIRITAERADPFHGHHPEHQSAQGTP